MVKSYPGFGPVFLILFLIIIGLVSFSGSESYSLIFVVVGIIFLFTLRTIKIEKEKIIVRQLITGKQTIINRDQISCISIVDPGHWAFTQRYPKYVRLIIEYKDKDLKNITISPPYNTSFYKIEEFVRKNYPELIIKQEIE